MLLPFALAVSGLRRRRVVGGARFVPRRFVWRCCLVQLRLLLLLWLRLRGLHLLACSI